MSLYRPLVLSLALVLGLTACNKNDSAQAPKADNAQATAPADDLDNSPTVLVMADMLKFGAWAYIQSTGAINDKTTDEQLNCLFDYDKALFLQAGKEEVTKNLSADLIKQSDEFYRTEVGKKVLKFTEQSQLQAQGRPIEGEPVVITDEDKAKMAEFGQSEAGQKIAQAMNAGAVQGDLKALVTQLGEKEKARCKL